MSRLAKGCMCIAVAVLCAMHVAIPHANEEIGFDGQIEIISPFDIREDKEEGNN